MKTTSFFFFFGLIALLFCNFTPSRSSIYLSNDNNYQTDNDTTVHNVPFLDETAILPDAVNYFLKNNKYKDWKEEAKACYIAGVVEKDGTLTNITVKRSSGVDYLDKEAIRLAKAAKYEPGTFNKKIVRSAFMIGVHFPAPKQ